MLYHGCESGWTFTYGQGHLTLYKKLTDWWYENVAAAETLLSHGEL